MVFTSPKLPIKLSPKDEHDLIKKFKLATDVYNHCAKYINKQLYQRRTSPLLKKALKLPKGKERNKILKELDTLYPVTKFGMIKIANDYARVSGYQKKHIGADIAGALGRRAYEAYEKVKLSPKGYLVKPDMISSIEGHKESTPIIVKGEKLTYKTVSGTVMYRGTDYEVEALSNKCKYNRILLQQVNGKNRFYLQKVLDGVPPVRSISSTKGVVGIDIGASSVALVSDNEAYIFDLSGNLDFNRIGVKISRLQRMLDHKRRYLNPNKYNENGTIKKGNKEPWVKSKAMLKLEQEISALYSNYSTRRRIITREICNLAMDMGDSFKVEKMNQKALQARAKETKVNEQTGKFQSKKRLGKSILKHAPAEFVETIKWKSAYADKEFQEVNTYTVRASQLDHSTGDCVKKSLSTRRHYIDGSLVQRDLYSAFLIQHVGDDGQSVDLASCERDFGRFLYNQETAMLEADRDNSSIDAKGFLKELGSVEVFSG